MSDSHQGRLIAQHGTYLLWEPVRVGKALVGVTMVPGPDKSGKKSVQETVAMEEK